MAVVSDKPKTIDEKCTRCEFVGGVYGDRRYGSGSAPRYPQVYPTLAGGQRKRGHPVSDEEANTRRTVNAPPVPYPRMSAHTLWT